MSANVQAPEVLLEPETEVFPEPEIEMLDEDFPEDSFPVTIEGGHRVMRAIISNSVKEALKEDAAGLAAREWLVSQKCRDWCQLTGMSLTSIEAWIAEGCSDARWTKKGRKARKA